MKEPKPSKEPSLARSRLTLLALVGIFVGPILIAYAFTSGLLDIDSEVRTNRGTLINPALDLRQESATEGLIQQANLAPGEWLVAYLQKGACEALCQDALQRLLTIRSVLGYSGQRVRIIAVTSKASEIDPSHQREDPAALEVLLPALGLSPNEATVVLLDWRKQAVVRFAADAPSIDIKKDLKKLLRASKIR